MAINYSGPYQLRFNYQPLEVSRQFRLHIDLNNTPSGGDDSSTIEYVTRDGFGTDLSFFVENVLGDIGEGFKTAANTFGQVELWKYQPNSEVASFISAYTPINQSLSAGDNIANNQFTFTFRTIEGGVAKLVLLDCAFDIGDTQINYPTGIPALDNIFDGLSAGDSPMLGKDTSFAFAPFKVSQGQNELLWRNRNR